MGLNNHEFGTLQVEITLQNKASVDTITHTYGAPLYTVECIYSYPHVHILTIVL